MINCGLREKILYQETSKCSLNNCGSPILFHNLLSLRRHLHLKRGSRRGSRVRSWLDTGFTNQFHSFNGRFLFYYNTIIVDRMFPSVSWPITNNLFLQYYQIMMQVGKKMNRCNNWYKKYCIASQTEELGKTKGYNGKIGLSITHILIILWMLRVLLFS